MPFSSFIYFVFFLLCFLSLFFLFRVFVSEKAERRGSGRKYHAAQCGVAYCPRCHSQPPPGDVQLPYTTPTSTSIIITTTSTIATMCTVDAPALLQYMPFQQWVHVEGHRLRRHTSYRPR